ncbi:DUF2178 domain-containing protein [Christensenellaceae bacterium OttesenSCG-928-M15]|nr:DUF2178 domain-containing protein [Christensenellaceae bacterium OttesenSCG-928-M15]
MTYNSKRTIASMAVGVILFIAYIIYALSKPSPTTESLASWAITMLVFIGIGVAGLIVVQVLFHIAFAIGIAVKEQHRSDKDVERIISASVVEDERDKQINMKASHIGYIIVGMGFMAALVALALESSAVVALHILFAAFFTGSFVEGAVGVYLHERGFHHG